MRRCFLWTIDTFVRVSSVNYMHMTSATRGGRVNWSKIDGFFPPLPVFWRYILKEWSYGHDILYPCRTRLTGCSEEKMKFIGRLENFLDDFEKKVSKQNLGFHRPSIEYSGLIGASFSKNRRKCVSPAIKSFWWVGWYFYYYQ